MFEQPECARRLDNVATKRAREPCHGAPRLPLSSVRASALRGFRSSACHFSPVDHAQIARACGSEAMRIENAVDILPMLQNAIRSGKPWLLDVVTDPDAHPSLSLYDGTLGHAEAPETALLE